MKSLIILLIIVQNINSNDDGAAELVSLRFGGRYHGSVVPVEAGLRDALSGRRAGGAGGTTVLHIAAAHRLHTGQRKQVSRKYSRSMAHINSVVFVQTVTVSWSRSDWKSAVVAGDTAA